MTLQVKRTGVTTFQGQPVTLLGDQVAAGDPAPDFTVLANDFSPVTLAGTGSGVRIFSVVPSLETEVCDTQTRRFTTEAAALAGVTVWTVSADLPFAQRRWCGASGLADVKTVSDHHDLSFGRAYGVAVAELRLLARAVFVVDAADRIAHVEYVPEIVHHPDYAAALDAAKRAGS
ncbi:thiol peroxidase [Actinosynnema sp. CS-041913]|uniref:thiol peroxidase n=1 Tax=Actinosynnema sp. CS-041913 TaxID=3239917 RepID=UPI003D927AB0